MGWRPARRTPQRPGEGRPPGHQQATRRHGARTADGDRSRRTLLPRPVGRRRARRRTHPDRGRHRRVPPSGHRPPRATPLERFLPLVPPTAHPMPPRRPHPPHPARPDRSRRQTRLQPDGTPAPDPSRHPSLRPTVRTPARLRVRQLSPRRNLAMEADHRVRLSQADTRDARLRAMPERARPLRPPKTAGAQPPHELSTLATGSSGRTRLTAASTRSSSSRSSRACL